MLKANALLGVFLTVVLTQLFFRPLPASASPTCDMRNINSCSADTAEVALAAEVPEVAALVAATEEAPAAVPVVEVAPAEATAVMDCQTARR
jgi:hypothetical protein